MKSEEMSILKHYIIFDKCSQKDKIFALPSTNSYFDQFFEKVFVIVSDQIAGQVGISFRMKVKNEFSKNNAIHTQ